MRIPESVDGHCLDVHCLLRVLAEQMTESVERMDAILLLGTDVRLDGVKKVSENLGNLGNHISENFVVPPQISTNNAYTIFCIGIGSKGVSSSSHFAVVRR